MRLAALIPLVGCVWNALLAGFVLWNGFDKAAHRVFFFLGISIAVWNLGQFSLFVTSDPEQALFWARFLWLGVIFIPVLLYHLSLIIAELPPGRLLWWAYGISGLVAISDATPLFLKGVRYLGNPGFYAVAGPLFPAFMGLFSLVFLTIYILFQRRKTLPRPQRPG